MSVSALAEAVHRDYGLRLDTRWVADPNRVVTLCTATAVTKAALLDQLGAKADLTWHYLTCPNGATILWGSHPDVIVLESRK
jgi:hypothetical protein